MSATALELAGLRAAAAFEALRALRTGLAGTTVNATRFQAEAV